MVTRSSMRVIDDFGLTLSSIFRVNHPLFNKSIYYAQAQKLPDMFFECCVGYQMSNMFSFGLKTHGDIKLTDV